MRAGFGLRAGALFACVVMMSGGCGEHGPATATVSGKITYKQQPLRTGSISAFSQDGPTTGAEIKEDGSYEIKNVPVGSTTFTITAFSEEFKAAAKALLKGKRENKEGKKGGKQADPLQVLKQGNRSLIPEFY